MGSFLQFRPPILPVLLLSSGIMCFAGLPLYHGDLPTALYNAALLAAGWLPGVICGRFIRKRSASLSGEITGYILSALLFALALRFNWPLAAGWGLALALNCADATARQTLYNGVIAVFIIIASVLALALLPMSLLIAAPQLGVIVLACGGSYVVVSNIRKLGLWRGFVLLCALVFMGYSMYNYWWQNPDDFLPRQYRELIQSKNQAVLGDRLRQEAYGDLMLISLLPAHDDITVYYRGGIFNGYLDVLNTLPYVKKIVYEPLPTETGYPTGYWKKVSVRGLDNTPLRYDVVVAAELPTQVTACDMLIDEYIKMAENGFLILPSGVAQYLSPETLEQLGTFEYKHNLRYPAKFTIYGHRETEQDLAKLDALSQRLYPANTFMPPGVMPFLLDNISLAKPAKTTAEFDWPQENILQPVRLNGLKYFLAALFLYAMIRLMLARNANQRETFNGIECGVYAGTMAALIMIMMIASGLAAAWPLIVLAGAFLLLPNFGGSAVNFSWRRNAGHLLLLASPLLLNNAAVIILLLAVLLLLRPLQLVADAVRLAAAPLYLLLFTGTEPRATLMAAGGTLLANLLLYNGSATAAEGSALERRTIWAMAGFAAGILLVWLYGYNQYFAVAATMLCWRLPMTQRLKAEKS